MPKLISQDIETADVPDFSFAPGKIVIRITEDLGFVFPIKVDEIIQTGIPSIDDLCWQFRVHGLRRLFPAPKYPTPDLTRYYVVEFDESNDLDQVLNEFSKISSLIEKAEKVGRHKSLVGPNDDEFEDQWHLEQTNDCDIDAPEAWDTQKGSDSVILAITDSGVYRTHPDLNNNIWINWDEYYGEQGEDDDPGGNGYVDDIYGWNWDVSSGPGNNNVTDYLGHGTHIAGIVAAETNNDEGVAGIAGGWYPNQTGCRIMCLRVGFIYWDMDHVAAGINYAADMGADAINCSWSSSYSEYLEDAIDYAIQNEDVLIVAAAGNEGGNYCSDTQNHYLNTRSDVLVVAATDQNDQRAVFGGGQASNYGNCVDVSAPGKSILSVGIGSPPNYVVNSGTSMAAPMAVGLAGLLKSQRSDWNRNKIWGAIVQSADPIEEEPGKEMGSGRINAHYAVKQTWTPAAPSNLNAYPVSWNQINLSWQDNANNELQFWVQRKKGSGSWYILDIIPERDVTSDKDTTATAGNTYYYRVYTYNMSGLSPSSNIYSTMIPTTPPAAPAYLEAEQTGPEEITLWWDDESNNEQGFRIYRKTQYGSWQNIDSVSPNTMTYEDSNPPSGSGWVYYKVRAYNPSGWADSNVESVWVEEWESQKEKPKSEKNQ